MKRLAVLLAVLPVVVAGPASAGNFGGWFANNYLHYFYYQNLGAAWASATTSARNNALNPTAIDTHMSSHDSSDVAVLDNWYDATWQGLYQCQWGSWPTCNHAHVNYNLKYQRSDASKRVTACEEIGHSVGLKHAPDERLTCMSTRFSEDYDDHDRAHITEHYGWQRGYYAGGSPPSQEPSPAGFCNHGWEPECETAEPPPSSPPPPPPPPPPVFSDGFEAGNFSNWTTNSGLTAQQQEVSSGSWAARGSTTSAATWAYKSLGTSYTELYYQVRFKVISQGSSSTMNVLKFRTSTGASILGLYRHSGGNLGYRNDVAADATTSSTPISIGEWYLLQIRVRINGASGETETWLDGVRIAALSRIEDFGTTPIARIQIGENSPNRTYDVAIDDVVANTIYIG